MPQATPRRKRRRPEEAEAEILRSAERLLRKRALHELTVEEIMRGTTLSRKSFYVYFRDRHALLERLFGELRKKLDAGNRVYLDEDEVLPAGHAALTAVAEIARETGGSMRALFEASTHDARATRLWRQFNEPVVAAFTAKIEKEVKAGRVPPVRNAEGMARLLVGMNLFALFDQVMGNPKADVAAIVDSLHEVWTRALTLHPVPSGERRRRK
jgi:AcrR family transcriptional regulator